MPINPRNKKKYTDRKKVYRGFEYLGAIACFGEDDWRCSAYPDSPKFKTAEEAEDHLKTRSSKKRDQWSLQVL